MKNAEGVFHHPSISVRSARPAQPRSRRPSSSSTSGPIRSTKPVQLKEPKSSHSLGRAKVGTEKNMETFVGIDVSKDRLDVAVRPSAEAIAVENDDAEIGRVAGR